MGPVFGTQAQPTAPLLQRWLDEGKAPGPGLNALCPDASQMLAYLDQLDPTDQCLGQARVNLKTAVQRLQASLCGLTTPLLAYKAIRAFLNEVTLVYQTLLMQKKPVCVEIRRQVMNGIIEPLQNVLRDILQLQREYRPPQFANPRFKLLEDRAGCPSWTTLRSEGVTLKAGTVTNPIGHDTGCLDVYLSGRGPCLQLSQELEGLVPGYPYKIILTHLPIMPVRSNRWCSARIDGLTANEQGIYIATQPRHRIVVEVTPPARLQSRGDIDKTISLLRIDMDQIVMWPMND